MVSHRLNFLLIHSRFPCCRRRTLNWGSRFKSTFPVTQPMMDAKFASEQKDGRKKAIIES
jgi:hypothetical protein